MSPISRWSGEHRRRYGNLIFHKATRQFNPLCAMAAASDREVEQLVEPGEIDPEAVICPASSYSGRRGRHAGKRIER